MTDCMFVFLWIFARDELRLDPNRLGFWAAGLEQGGEVHFSPFAEWDPLGEGAYGKVFLVPLFPPISIRGERVTKAVVKAAKKAKTAGELNLEIKVSSSSLPSFSLPSLSLTLPFPLFDLFSFPRPF